MAFVKAYFPRIQKLLRIATAYFSLKGYRMALPYLPTERRVQLRILVGKRDGYLVERTVLEDLRAELERGVKLASLYEAVFDLYQRMRAGELTIGDARQMERPFHCKFYLSDATSVFHGSANFSGNGLQDQAEQLTYSTDKKLLEDWTEWFEEVAAGATDLQAELRKLLADWLEMATPFQIYLRALELLLAPTRELNHKAGAHTPVPYQRALAAWAVRQLVAHRGAVLVVATGLGKTVIGAEAVGQLWRAGHIDRVLVLAPPPVHDSWEKQLKGRGLQDPQHYVQFGIKALFRVNPAPRGQAARLLTELEQAGPTTLLLIDEAHEYRNQQQATQAKLHNKAKKRNQNSSGSLVFDRLLPALAAGAHVLLLTGSAYGTSRLNLSSLLRLLPPTAPEMPPNPIQLLPADPTGPQPWVAMGAAEFGNLPVVAVFTYPHALYLTLQQQPLLPSAGSEEATSPYLPFAHGPGYLPLGINSTTLYYAPPCWEEIQSVFDRGCFAQQRPITTEGYTDETGPLIGKTDVLAKQGLAAWLSSPAALIAAIRYNLATADSERSQMGLAFSESDLHHVATAQPSKGQLLLWAEQTPPPLLNGSAGGKKTKKKSGVSYGTPLRMMQEERERQLAPILALLTAPDLLDAKLDALCRLLHELCVISKGQAIIFVRQHLTAVYLEQKLRAVFKSRPRIACMVDVQGGLKSAAERLRIREKFAPLAHDLEGRAYYHILICTDADSLGVNLQDASNVVNYDWPNSADGLVQRLGRILRPAPYAGRVPQVFTFAPECLRPPREATVTSRIVRSITHQYDRLLRRHAASAQLLGFPVLGTDDASHIPLNTGVDATALADKLSETTMGLSTAANNWVPHIETLEKHRAMLSQLPVKAMHTARLWPENYPRIVVLLHYEKGTATVVYDLATDLLHKTLPDLTILNLLRAEPDEEAAGVNLPRIMHYADIATKRWCERENIKPNRIKRLAALYLHPAHQAEDFDYLLKVDPLP